MLVLLILGISIILQCGAAFLAYKITKLSGHRAWNLIVISILIMAVRRSATFYTLIQNDNTDASVKIIELVALSISILMFVGLYKIHPYLKTLFASEQNLKLTNQQLSEEIKSHQLTGNKLVQFKTTLDQTLDSVFMFRTDDLKFFYVNQGAINLMGYTEEEIKKMTPLDIKPEFTEDTFRETLRPMMEGQKESIMFRTLHLHKSGKTIPVEISLQLVKSSKADARFVAIVRDIENQIKIENELKTINRELETFIYKASHDLRGPIATSNGLLNLSSSAKKLSEHKKLVGLLKKSHKKLSSTLDDLMVVIKLKRGSVEPTIINCKNFIHRILEKLKRSEGYNSININTNVPSELKINTDDFFLWTIIENILSNSIDYRNRYIDNSFLKIEIKNKDKGILILIEDNGNGISKNELSKVFNLFHRSSIDSVGSGMGLFIVKLAVSKLKGTISLSSEENKGTYFDIWLPNLSTDPDITISLVDSTTSSV
jgi:PAS domain S-box-containing protein